MENKNVVAPVLLATVGVEAGLQDAVLDGHYNIKLKIGDMVSDNEMELCGVHGPIRLLTYGGPIQGSITVSGLFKSPIEGNGFCSSWDSQCHLIFSTTAYERGQSYKVRYDARLNFDNYMKVVNQNAQPVLTGSAYHENGHFLGTFEATRK